MKNQLLEELGHQMEYKDVILVPQQTIIGAIAYRSQKKENATQIALNFPTQYSTLLQFFLR